MEASGGNWYHESDEHSKRREIPQKPPFVAFVGNVPFDTSKDEVLHALGAAIESVSNARPMTHRSGVKVRGYFVEFTTSDALVKALEADGVVIGDRQLRVNIAEERKTCTDKGHRNSHDRGHRRNLHNSHREQWTTVGDISAQRIVEPAVDRPKLVLKPRSIEKDSGEVAVGKSSIFGCARPIDTSKVLEEIERKIDAELHRDHAKQKQKIVKKGHKVLHHAAIVHEHSPTPVEDSNVFSLLSIEDDE